MTPQNPTRMTKFTDNTGTVAVIKQEARAVALSFGMAAPDDVASVLAERLMLRLGGDMLYFPKRRASIDRHREIRSRFRGDNAAELAREYGLTQRSVRRIAKS